MTAEELANLLQGAPQAADPAPRPSPAPSHSADDLASLILAPEATQEAGPTATGMITDLPSAAARGIYNIPQMAASFGEYLTKDLPDSPSAMRSGVSPMEAKGLSSLMTGRQEEPSSASKGLARARELIASASQRAFPRFTPKGESQVMDALISGAEIGGESLVGGGPLRQALKFAGITGGGAAGGHLAAPEGSEEVGALVGAIGAPVAASIPSLFRLLSRQGPVDEAVAILERSLPEGSPPIEEVIDALQAVKGGPGSAGYQTGMDALLRVERGLAGVDRAFADRLKEADFSMFDETLSRLQADTTPARRAALKKALDRDIADRAAQVERAREQAGLSREEWLRDLQNESLPDGYQIETTGRKAFADAADNMSRAYDDGWARAGRISDNTMSDVDQIVANSGVLGESELGAVRAAQRRVKDAYEKGSPEALQSMDREIRQMQDKAARETQFDLVDALSAIRNRVRDGMPEEAASLIRAADAVYPRHRVLSAAADKAAKERRIPTEQEVLESSVRLSPTGRSGQQRGILQPEAESGIEAALARERDIRRIETSAPPVIERVAAFDPEAQAQAVAQVVRGKSPKADLHALAQAADTPEARKGLESMIKENLASMRFGAGGGGFKGAPKTGAAKERYESTREALGEIYGKSALDKFDLDMDRANKILERNKLAYAQVPVAGRNLAYYTSAVLGLKAGSLVSGHPLFGAALGRRMATGAYEKATSKKAIATLKDMMLRPQNYREELEAAKKIVNQRDADLWVNRLIAFGAQAERAADEQSE